MSASIGVAIAPHDGDDLASVLNVADKRMYEVKQAGKAGLAMASGGKAS